MTTKIWSPYPGSRPWRRGRKKRPADFGPYKLYVIDPDFDSDNESECVWFWRSEIERHGAVAIHPDGDRRHGRDDPVPLHQRSYIGAVTPEIERKWYELERKRVLSEPVEIAEHWQLTAPPKLKPMLPRPKPMWEPPARLMPQGPPPEPRPWERAGPEMLKVLSNMNLNQPISVGSGRVFEDYVAVNAVDAPALAYKWAEVWKGGGVVVFRMGWSDEGWNERR